MTLGEVLSVFMQQVGDIIMPYVIVNEWEQGVKTKLGKIVKTCTHLNGVRGRGLHFYWPVVGAIDVQDCNLSTMQSDDQTLTTQDGETVVVALTLSYRVRDAGRFYRWIHDQDETIENVLESAVGRSVPGLDWWDDSDKEDWSLTTNLIDQVIEEIKPKLRKWGVEIVDLAVHTMARARTYRLIT